MNVNKSVCSHWPSSGGAGGGGRPDGGARVPPLPGAQAAGRPRAHHGRPIRPAAPRRLGAQRGGGERKQQFLKIIPMYI